MLSQRKSLIFAVLGLTASFTILSWVGPMTPVSDGFTGIELNGCQLDVRPVKVPSNFAKDAFVTWSVGWDNSANPKEFAKFEIRPEQYAKLRVSGTQWTDVAHNAPVGVTSVVTIKIENSVLVGTFYDGTNTYPLTLRTGGNYDSNAMSLEEPALIPLGNVPGAQNKSRVHLKFRSFGITTAFTLSD